MDLQVRFVNYVSDGIVVTFSNGTHCYFSAQFLMSQVGKGSNQVLTAYDHSESGTSLAQSAVDSIADSWMS